MKRYSVLPLKLSGFIVSVFALMVSLSSCSKQEMATPSSSTTPPDQPVVTTIPKSPGSIPIPDNNKMTDAKVELGRHLFFDKQISVDNSTSCASCHQASNAFSDIFPTSRGMQGQHGTRNAPALANIAYNTEFTWDGRFTSLEDHAPGPIFNSVEMGNNFSTSAKDTVPSGYNSEPGQNDTNFLFKRLGGDESLSMRKDVNGKSYRDLISDAWGTVTVKTSTDGGKTFTTKTGTFFTMDIIAKSIACFERTLISTQSTFDAYNNGDESVYKYNPEALRGLKLFTDVNGANCISCHSGYNFTDQQFHDNGIGINQNSDKGRFNIKNDPSNVGKFKTPSLRNVALTGPYMHDGRFATLEQVLDNYNKGGIKRTENTDSKIKPLNLSDQDVADIIEFLKTLTDSKFTDKQNQKFSNPWSN